MVKTKRTFYIFKILKPQTIKMKKKTIPFIFIFIWSHSTIINPNYIFNLPIYLPTSSNPPKLIENTTKKKSIQLFYGSIHIGNSSAKQLNHTRFCGFYFQIDSGGGIVIYSKLLKIKKKKIIAFVVLRFFFNWWWGGFLFGFIYFINFPVKKKSIH